jgi:hypothetical protein
MLLALPTFTTSAAQIAWDNASQPAYDDGWQSGDNGGTGFGPWTITSTGGGTATIGSSTANGDSQPPTGDIDSAGGRAWGLSNVVQTQHLTAIRPLTGSLAVGQHLSFDVDGICLGPNSEEMYVRLGNASETRWALDIHVFATHMLYAGVPSYGTEVSTATPEGMHVDFSLTGPDTFLATAQVLGADPVVVSGALNGAAGAPIDQVELLYFSTLAPEDIFYANNFAVTPEPGLPATCAGLALALTLRRGRRRTPRHD